MKLNEKLECPFCGSKNTHAHQYTDVTIWDDKNHEALNNAYPNYNKLNCDTITYKCKCDENNCEKHFIVKVKLKCEIEDIIVAKDVLESYKQYFKKF
jgi:hypothetical protein